MMQSLRDILKKASAEKVAIGHFNISDLTGFEAIVQTAEELSVPVMIGVSEGERDFVGVEEIAALVREVRKSRGIPVFLNADHTHSLEAALVAAKAGFDEVLFDGSKLPFDENVRQTKAAVEAIRSINPEIVVEGELGYIGSSSGILKDIPEGAALTSELLTTPEQALEFVQKTGVDILAPAVGNMHGLLTSMVEGKVEKHLDIPRIAAIKEKVGIWLTLHGGSGTADKDFLESIAHGITIVHVNTELRLAWRRGLEAGLAKDPNEVAPYKILPGALEAMKKVVKDRLSLFSRRM